jgi:hypothetical protein
MKLCLGCGKKLPKYKSKYCESECYLLFREKLCCEIRCEGCGELFVPLKAGRRFCSQKCHVRNNLNQDTEHQKTAAKAGNAVIIAKFRGSGRGYIKVLGRHLHRRKAEAALGRRLKRHEVVHHIDCNPRNNDNSNLMIVTQSYHAWLHSEMRKRNLPPVSPSPVKQSA